MSDLDFGDVFKKAMGSSLSPHAYQCRLACGPDATLENIESLRHGTQCCSLLINIPTGLGKTAGVILAWLWNRILYPDSSHRDSWPRRLVYCLPMRSLVEQTRDVAKTWLQRLASQFARDAKPEENELAWLAANSPVILMGGEAADAAQAQWDIWPEKPTLIIGTQDMLLSRALNRGYGMSRYRWPMHFGLLNNDCLWVMDETQLMGPGLSTACQLEAFRASNASGFGALGNAGSATWYVSATGNPEHLKTRDWRNVQRPDGFEFGLSEAEKNVTDGRTYHRRRAVKVLKLKPELDFGNAQSPGETISDVLNKHCEMLAAIANHAELPARTLIICNTVDRAVSVHAAINKQKPAECDLVLLHSRFRPPERRDRMERLKPENLRNFTKGQIVVATQVIEAGVDLSSAVLWSEVAPLASLVQRLGRLNRAGEFNSSAWKPTAFVVGVGVEGAPPHESKDVREKRDRENIKRSLPYDLTACEAAWESLQRFNGDASPANLEQIQDDIAASIPRCPYSLQRHELVDFFDTDANLSLGFTDVSPFVRGLDEDTDVHVLWRENWLQEDSQQGTGKPGLTPDFQRDEICSIPISKARAALEILNQGWLWRGKESGWTSVRDAGIAPGMTILLPLKEAGGYNEEAGWTGSKADNKHRSRYKPEAEPPDEDLLSCLEHGWRSITVHTAEVSEELDKLIKELLPGDEYASERDALRSAVPWHDIGKNHERWQQTVIEALEKAQIAEAPKAAHKPFAKFSLSESPSLSNADGTLRFTGAELKREVNRLRNSFRPRITHEVASALAFRQAEQARLGASRDTDSASLLAEYAIMSHHGRVRKVLRDEIPKFPKNEKDNDTVRGVETGSVIPPVSINGNSLGCESLSTDCRRMGRDRNGHESYTRGVLRLLDCHGPFRLAFFEAIFRAADMRASARASHQPSAGPKP